ncbi:hypothetical protein IWQ62_005310 [Dispira parvispora]|uniref:Uncharacterized protein n=1 Tax=Dispira parvispora TaxID=1520584 RepID=A0A9W8AQP1_9FUNG|nr:hypothetical protein IWQ62_005310 [Dispira parvispora]
MKILLAYVFLQAVMPSYLLACNKSPKPENLDVQTLNRRDLGVQPTHGQRGSVGKLQRRYYSSHSDTSDSDSGKRNHRHRHHHRGLYRRGDYSMLQSKHTPIGNLHRRQVDSRPVNTGDNQRSYFTSASDGSDYTDYSDDDYYRRASLDESGRSNNGGFWQGAKDWTQQAKDKLNPLP